MKKAIGIGLKTMVLAFALFVVDGWAQSPGTLDTTFGTNGRVVTPLTTTATIYDLAVQPDGKTIAVGVTFGNAPNGDIIPGNTGFVARFNINGTLDTTFDTNGYNNSGFLNSVSSVVVQPDGKIVVGGTGSSVSTNQGLGAARFNSDGSLDTTFNGIGKNAVGVGTNAFGTGISVQADGKVIVAGNAIVNGSQDFALVRYNADGTLDTTFGSNGRQATYVNGYAAAFRAAVQRDGKIILTGYSRNSTATLRVAAIVRYNSNGTLDTTFGTNGIVTNEAITIETFAYKVYFQPDGKIIVTGTLYYNNSPRSIIRYNQNGTLDTAFQSAAVGASVLRIRPDGKIQTAGGSSSGGQNGFGLARYNADGTLDQTFGTNGTTFSEFSGNASASQAVFTPDGKVVAGGTQFSSNYQIVLARYFGDTSTGRAAMDFDGDGKSDVSVFRPSTGVWYFNNSQNGFSAIAFGVSTDKLVPADYDGDGKTDVAVYRDGVWYLNRSQLGFTGISFGAADDIPVPADFTGDGKAEIAVFRPSTGIWYQFNMANNQMTAYLFGQQGDNPIPADYDGDGIADIAVYRVGGWFIQGSRVGLTGNQSFGGPGGQPVPADYDGDGKTDLALRVLSNGQWIIQRSSDGVIYVMSAADSEDIFVPADYNGDGKTDACVYRPSNGTWYLVRISLVPFAIFGASTDMPIPNAYIR